MALIHIKDLTFCYDGSYDNIFEHVSFQIDTDWKLGFIGRNGRGKTTFLNLLLGKYEYSGQISSPEEFTYFPFAVEHPEWNTRAVAERVCPGVQEWELLRELSLLEVEEDVLDRPFSTLSNGEQTKVLLAALFLNEDRFLLIDEPTNHLDEQARRTVSRYLSRKRGFILVSHDRAFLDQCVDHILSINKTNIEIQRGNFSSWQENKSRRDQFELAEHEKLQKETRRLAETAKRAAGWSDALEKTKYGTRNAGLRPDRGFIGHKSAKMMKRAKAAEERRSRAAEEKAKLLKNLEEEETLKIHPLEYRTETLAEAVDLRIRYRERVVCGPLNFKIERGECVALCGRNGCGKSSVLKLVAGKDVPHEGILRTGSGLRISYVPQEASFLSGDLKEFAEKRRIEEPLFKAILRKLDFSRMQFEKNMEEYSAGQKKKVLIAASLCEEAHLYLWDEPLNYIDVLSRIQIERLIREFRPAMLLVEHDSAFLEEIEARRIFLQQ